MARYDKYDGVAGGFRAEAAAANASGYGTPVGASVNTSGKALLGAAGNTGFKGVCIVDATKRKAGDILDIMTNGEIVYDSDDASAALTAGTVYYLHATTGALQTTETRYMVGHTVEAWRLVVRFSDQGAA